MLVMPKKEDSVLWLCDECEEVESLKKLRKRAHIVLDSDDEIPVKELTKDKRISRRKGKKDQARDSREKLEKDQTGEKLNKYQTGDKEISEGKLKKDQTRDKATFREKLKKDRTGDKAIISRKKLKTNPTDEKKMISTKELKKNQSEDKGLKPEKHEIQTESKQLHSYVISAEPLIRSLWTGSVSIRNNNESIYTRMYEFSAYLSSKARQDVCNEVARFRQVLKFEMVPKSRVWPKQYEGSGPTDDNIGLYLFPSLIKYEQVYDYLVFEMIRDDMALRASMENAELLVFTSVELPLPFRRFQGKLFLWGVFREY
ncbi:hypothetical protein CDL12_14363 [Handroanthus impetiginosus]|uniref:AIPP2-like SPOC-like domain-containing protein n=1 Tax=Handroanthus impetiginosus TaxID=429701 RepID=A0A2G9H672_9LAMI|nr:hypothetical protein CDL12_14363 [Handroanthus impetiginosus]